jgi:hypothetical protein
VVAQASNIEFSNTAEEQKQIPPTLKSEIINISHKAATDSAKHSLLYVEPFILLGFIVSFLLPNRRNVDLDQSLTKKV